MCYLFRFIILQITRVHNPDACPAFYKKFKNLFGTHDNIMSEFRDHLKNVMNRFPQFKDDPEKLGFLHDLSKVSKTNYKICYLQIYVSILDCVNTFFYKVIFELVIVFRKRDNHAQ